MLLYSVEAINSITSRGGLAGLRFTMVGLYSCNIGSNPSYYFKCDDFFASLYGIVRLICINRESLFRFWLWMTTGQVTKDWTAIHRKHHAKVETKRSS